ncbi:hypothetical protein H0I76_04685 [Limibaculum sp. M0105]|uniref:histidine kinase n=1 Tax=Thermohalobaculum xanthum TaxID=2753746 RepID=A0A8J7M685_9RHOB|nr:ATP-binding protein [Thermohalobaculum xanthum]MBK0398475.1 hypothetical protein [Thermohalobaculum xanthum]
MHADTTTLRFLVIYEHHSSLIANIEIAGGIEQRLAEALPTEREIYSVYLDNARFPKNPKSARFMGMLEENFSSMTFDVVMAVGPAALSFALEHQDSLAPGAPILFTTVAWDPMIKADLPPHVGGLFRAYDMANLMEFAMKLQPEARQIVVMSGSAEFDRNLASWARKTLGSQFAGLPVSFVSDLPLAGYVEAARGYDRNTILLILTILRDATGRKMLPSDAAGAIAASSGAPTYGFYSTFLRSGVMGGHITTFADIGWILADRALSAISDGGSGKLPITEAPGADVVNWPQLARFGIDRDLVPSDTERLFYVAPAWRRYELEIALATVVLLLQTATIAALIVQMRRRRNAARQLEADRLALAYSARASQLGQLSGAIAHELNQPLAAIMSNAEAGSRILDSETPDLAEVSEILSDIAKDDRRAAEIIVQLRRMMKEGEVEFGQIDLNAVISDTLKLSHSELIARRTDVDFRRSKEQITVLGNFTQLQQVVLNLLLNAADAMRELPPEQRQVLVESRVLADGTRQVVVSDEGPGVTKEAAVDAFRPFVSSKQDGLGLGLSICRSIAKAHGGTLAFEHDLKTGARIILALPEP